MQHLDGPRLWMPPPAAMETVMKLFNEDRIAHPWNPHVFVVPRLMTHLWRKQLGKDADVMFTVATRNHFWDTTQHEPLIVAIVLPLAHVHAYRGPWMARGSPQANSLAAEHSAGFKHFRDGKPSRLFELGSPLRDLWKDAQGRSGTLLREFLRWARSFPPVQECMVRGLLPGKPKRPVPEAAGSIGPRRQGGGSGDGREGPRKVQKRL